MEDVLVDARGEHRRELAQVGLPRGAVGAAGRRARLVGEDRVARQVTRAGLAAVVVEVLEAERLALGDVQQRARLHRVGLQAVGLDAELEAERVRPRLQRLDVVLVVEVGEDEVDVAAHAAAGVGVEVEDRLLVLLDRERQVREQAVADLLLERLREAGRPQRRVGLELQRVLEEGAAGVLEQARGWPA